MFAHTIFYKILFHFIHTNYAKFAPANQMQKTKKKKNLIKKIQKELNENL